MDDTFNIRKRNGRLEWVDIIKGIGIISVVVGHLSWNNFVNYSKKTIQEQKAVLLNFAQTTAKRVTYDMIPARPAVPLLTVADKNQSFKLT